MEPEVHGTDSGLHLQQMWRDAEAYISKKTTRSSDVTEAALRRMYGN